MQAYHELAWKLDGLQLLMQVLQARAHELGCALQLRVLSTAFRARMHSLHKQTMLPWVLHSSLPARQGEGQMAAQWPLNPLDMHKGVMDLAFVALTHHAALCIQ